MEKGIGRIETTHNQIRWERPFQSTTTQTSRGTGFFVKTDSRPELLSGHQTEFMMTCAHVVSNANITNIRVVLPNDTRRKYRAAVVMTCPEVDIAVVAVMLPKQVADQIEYLQLGNSDKINALEDVLVVGFPLGGGVKITKGNYSGFAKGKGIQHSSPISPGNSGCPLLNKKKEVIGVNYQGISAMSVSNIFFAVPINLAMIVIYDAISRSNKSILYRIPRLGICYQNTTMSMLKALQPNAEQVDEGVIVYRFENKAIESLLHLNKDEEEAVNSIHRLADNGCGVANQTSFLWKKISWDSTQESPMQNKQYIQCLLDEMNTFST